MKGPDLVEEFVTRLDASLQQLARIITRRIGLLHGLEFLPERTVHPPFLIGDRFDDDHELEDLLLEGHRAMKLQVEEMVQNGEINGPPDDSFLKIDEIFARTVPTKQDDDAIKTGIMFIAKVVLESKRDVLHPPLPIDIVKYLTVLKSLAQGNDEVYQKCNLSELLGALTRLSNELFPKASFTPPGRCGVVPPHTVGYPHFTPVTSRRIILR